VQYLNNVSASVGSVMKPAGFENSQGIITAPYLKDPTDKQWDDDEDMKAGAPGWTSGCRAPTRRRQLRLRLRVSSLMHETLKKCGDDLTRATS
jgi:branched-chain amino acid transport system substrate-binding protein